MVKWTPEARAAQVVTALRPQPARRARRRIRITTAGLWAHPRQPNLTRTIAAHRTNPNHARQAHVEHVEHGDGTFARTLQQAADRLRLGDGTPSASWPAQAALALKSWRSLLPRHAGRRPGIHAFC